MTRRTNARLAGVTLLLYIVTGLTNLALAKNPSLAGLNVLLGLLQAVYAIVLGVTLYALTRDADHELALFGLIFRTGEGFFNTLSAAHAAALDGAGPVSAVAFAYGSTCFSWVFLKAGSIPRWMAWLGVFASVLCAVVLSLQLAGMARGMLTNVIWAPMLVFEVALAFWLIGKGVPEPAT